MIVTKANVYVVDTGGFRPPIVELITDEGISGIGEGAVGFGMGARASASLMAELAEAFIVGQDPANINDIWNDFYYHTFWGKGAGAIFYAAVSALEHALWDIKGQALGVPVYELLGGRVRDELRVYANGWADGECGEPEQFARRALEVVADGYDAIKMYPLSKRDPIRNLNLHLKNREITKEEYERCLESVRQVRQAIGPDIDLMCDMTAEGTVDMMTKIGQEFEQHDLFWYEEPLDAFDVDSYRVLKDKVNIPIATGERLFTRYAFRRLLEIRGTDIVQPDPGTCGGIMEAIRIASMAEAYQMRIAPHNCGGPVLTAAAVQVAAVCPNFVIQEIFPYHNPLMYDIVKEPLEKTVSQGRLKVPEAPGLGVTLNDDFMKQYLVHSV